MNGKVVLGASAIVCRSLYEFGEALAAHLT